MKVDAHRRCLWVLSSHAGTGMPMKNPDPKKRGTSRVHKYDIDKRFLIQRFEVDNSKGRNFLNDLTIARNGDVYITDTQKKRIYRVKNSANGLELFFQMEKTMSPNGIDISEKYLFVAVYGGKNVVRINLKNSEMIVVGLLEKERISADGLYFFQNSLLAVQPHNSERVVARYFLDEDWNKVTKVKVLENKSPHFAQPTTGAVVGGDFFVIANSQLQIFKKVYNENDPTELKNPVVMRIKLRGRK